MSDEAKNVAAQNAGTAPAVVEGGGVTGGEVKATPGAPEVGGEPEGDATAAVTQDKPAVENKPVETKKDAPPGAKPPSKTNRIGLEIVDYKGKPSTLCQGCGHDAISAHIIKACFELGVDQSQLTKLSGIGCSSKSPAYFLGRAHGFNSVHGRMPAVATGVALANSTLTLLGVSGDGDTASIGLGQFCHLMRRNVDMVYIVENNGVYGLTKGQISATADRGAKTKGGVVNDLPAIDLCGLAVELGATFVARSFSGDPKQMLPLIKAALAHKGTAIIDVLSPCVTFNEHEDSTKSRKWALEHQEALHTLGYVPSYDQIHVDYDPGTTREVMLHDGSSITLEKVGEDYDPTDRDAAVSLIQKARKEKRFLTGLLFIDTKEPDFAKQLQLPATPLAHQQDADVRPGKEVLDEIMTSLK